MKKVFSVILVFAIITSLLACSPQDKIMGTYKIDKVEIKGEMFSVAQIEAMEEVDLSSVTLVVGNDGKAYLEYEEYHENFEWELTDVGIRIGEHDCDIVEDCICLKIDETAVYFKKSSNDTAIKQETEEKEVNEEGEQEEKDGEEEVADKDNEASGEKLDFSKDATIEETVLYNKEDVRISVLSLSYESSTVSMEFLFENNSVEDVTILAGTLGYSCFSVNGMMQSGGYINCEVTAGKRSKETISLSYDQLMLYGIDAIANVEIGFEIDNGKEETTTGPLKIETSMAEEYAKNPAAFRERINSNEAQKAYNYEVKAFAEEKLYSNDGVEVVSFCLAEKNEETILFLEVENTSNEDVSFRTSDISINKLKVQGSGAWSNDGILAGHKAIIDVNLSDVFDNQFNEVFGIEEVVSVDVGVSVNTEGKEGDVEQIGINVPEAVATLNTTGTVLYDGETAQIVFKGIIDDESEYSNDVYILLLVKNKGTEVVSVREKYDSFSINGFMSDCSFSSITVSPDEYAALEIHLYEYMLKDADVEAALNIEDFEMAFEIKNENYKTIETAVVQYKKS